jgi:hypothetical protein
MMQIIRNAVGLRNPRTGCTPAIRWCARVCVQGLEEEVESSNASITGNTARKKGRAQGKGNLYGNSADEVRFCAAKV